MIIVDFFSNPVMVQQYPYKLYFDQYL